MKTGFTLIELLVITVIIAVMSALVIPNLRFGEEQFAVQNSAHKLAQDLRRVKKWQCRHQSLMKLFPREGMESILRKTRIFILCLLIVRATENMTHLEPNATGFQKRYQNKAF